VEYFNAVVALILAVLGCAIIIYLV
jgi:hypothetical protein